MKFTDLPVLWVDWDLWFTAAHVTQRSCNVEDLLYPSMFSTYVCYLLLSLSFLRFHFIYTFNFIKFSWHTTNHLNSINTKGLTLNSPCSKISFVLWSLPLFSQSLRKKTWDYILMWLKHWNAAGGFFLEVIITGVKSKWRSPWKADNGEDFVFWFLTSD